MAHDNSIVYTSPTGYNYSYILPLEQDYIKNRLEITTWMKTYWFLLFPVTTFYLLTIYFGQKIMKNRPAFELRSIFILWNLGLAIYSILGTVRSVPELIYLLNDKGIKYSVCVETFSYGVTGYWSWLFTLSKFVELIDTLFLIVRKREIIFLHWYHHATVLSFVWYSIKDFPATARWFATINYSIHAIMYTYYTIMTLRIIRIPKVISMTITSLQIIQMVAGVYVTIKVYQFKSLDNSCDVSFNNIYAAFIMYASYFYLFFKFFFDKYFKNKTRQSVNGKKAE
jgi:elongation of very long chain fatty acids protein 6